MAQKSLGKNSKITGSIYNAKGKPISGVKVNCNEKYTRTLFDGTYRFENLAPSTYVVTVTQKGFQSQKRTIKLSKNKIVNLDFHLIPKEGSGRIYGYVFDSNTGKPITGGTMIMVLPSENKQVPIHPKDGYFEFSSLPSDTYQVWASVLGYEDEFKKINLKEKEEKKVDFFSRKKESIEPPWG